MPLCDALFLLQTTKTTIICYCLKFMLLYCYVLFPANPEFNQLFLFYCFQHRNSRTISALPIPYHRYIKRKDKWKYSNFESFLARLLYLYRSTLIITLKHYLLHHQICKSKRLIPYKFDLYLRWSIWNRYVSDPSQGGLLGNPKTHIDFCWADKNLQRFSFIYIGNKTVLKVFEYERFVKIYIFIE